jgi:putative endonuclease
MSLFIGILKEKQALHFLKQHGLHLLFTNFRSPRGEIDLIMRDQKTLSFIEVRYRHHSDYGTALESINFIKQKKIRNTAEYFLAKYTAYQTWPCRFDVVAFSKDNNTPEWIKNAF